MDLFGLSAFDAAVLAAAGLAAGLVNAVAGGGTFFSFTALLAVGLPPITANATNALAVTPGNLSSAFAYRREIIANFSRIRVLALISLVGGAIGAFLLTRIPNTAFAILVPWLLLFATVLFAFSPQIVRLSAHLRAETAGEPSTCAWLVGLAVQFLTVIYGGFFGAGMGIILLAALAVTEGDDYHRINAAKHTSSTLIQLASVTLFVAAGLIRWPHALVCGVGAVIGGYLGVLIGRRIPAPVMRWVVVAVGLVLTAYFFTKG